MVHIPLTLVPALLAVCITAIAGQQDIVTSPSNVTVDEGDTVILQCRTVNKVGNLYWIKDEAVLISSETDILITGDRHSISGNVGEGEYDLQIVGVTGSDSGNYMCLLASAGEQDQKLTEPAKLTVITIATESPQVTTTRDVPIQSFSLEPTDAEVGYGDTVIFRCTIANKRGTQVWFKEANGIAIEELVINNDERLSVTGNQSEGEYNLKIVNVTEEDAGNYSCTVRAMGNSPVISSEATLTVNVPSFAVTPTSITANEGDDVTLKCTVLNIDENWHVIWMKANIKVSTDTTIEIGQIARYSITGDEAAGEYFLQIENVHPDDDGDYYCILSGFKLSTSSPVATLVVIEIVQHTFVSEPESETVELNVTVTLNCQVDNKEGDVIWYKDDIAISNDDVTIIEDDRYSIVGDNTIGVYNLQIESTVGGDTGNFQCIVTSGDDSDRLESNVARLTVLTIPTITTAPMDQTVEEGDDVILQCSVANKDAELVWTKDGVTISTDMTTHDVRYTILGSQSQYNLHIDDVTSADSGVYTCQMEGNPPVAASANLNVAVFIPPDSNGPICTTDAPVIYAGDRVTITCEITGGDPRPTLQWSKETTTLQHNPINSDTGVKISYIIGPLTQSQVGDVYVCTSDHVSYTEAKTCQIGPIEIEYFRVQPQATRVLPYESTTLQCQISQTSGQAVWSKEGEEISVGPTITNGNNRYDVVGNHGDGEYNLKIDDISADDEGQYACTRLLVTRATQNSPFVTVYLDVDTETPHLYKTPISRSPREGYPVQLQCAKVNTDEDDQLQWRKDGQLISLDQSVEGAYQDRIYISGDHSKGEYYLNFYPILKSDGGSYTCQLSDVSSTSVTLSVRDALPPSHGFPSCTALDTELVIGSNITLECLSRDGQPPGELHWMRDHKRVSSYVVNSDDPDVIIIGVSLVLTSDDNGATYTCTLDHVTYDEPLTCVTGPLNVTGTETDWRVLAITFCVLLGVAIIIFIVVCIIIIWCVRNANKSIEADEENVEVVNADDKKDNKAHPKKDNVLLNNLDGSLKKKGKVDTSRDRKTPGKTTLTNTYYPPPSEYYDETLPSNGIGKRRLHSKNVVTPSKSKRMTNVVRNHQDSPYDVPYKIVDKTTDDKPAADDDARYSRHDDYHSYDGSQHSRSDDERSYNNSHYSRSDIERSYDGSQHLPYDDDLSYDGSQYSRSDDGDRSHDDIRRSESENEDNDNRGSVMRQTGENKGYKERRYIDEEIDSDSQDRYDQRLTDRSSISSDRQKYARHQDSENSLSDISSDHLPKLEQASGNDKIGHKHRNEPRTYIIHSHSSKQSSPEHEGQMDKVDKQEVDDISNDERAKSKEKKTKRRHKDKSTESPSSQVMKKEKMKLTEKDSSKENKRHSRPKHTHSKQKDRSRSKSSSSRSSSSSSSSSGDESARIYSKQSQPKSSAVENTDPKIVKDRKNVDEFAIEKDRKKHKRKKDKHRKERTDRHHNTLPVATSNVSGDNEHVVVEDPNIAEKSGDPQTHDRSVKQEGNIVLEHRVGQDTHKENDPFSHDEDKVKKKKKKKKKTREHTIRSRSPSLHSNSDQQRVTPEEVDEDETPRHKHKKSKKKRKETQNNIF